MNVHVLQFIRVHIHTHHIYLGILLENKNVCVKISNVVGTLVYSCVVHHTLTPLSVRRTLRPHQIPGTGMVMVLHALLHLSAPRCSTTPSYTHCFVDQIHQRHG